MSQFKRTAIAVAVAQIALMSGGAAMAQTAPAAGEPAVVVVSGQRAALQSAQKIKQNSDEIVDSIVADDIGKLPDRSVTEVLQRIVGVAIERTMSRGDPEHYSVEGSGVTIRGLTYVRSELNGRDSFSANGGRSLNFEDVPPELMAGVDVYKNPSAEQIEGAIGGLVNLRTAMPFDYKGFKGAVSASETYSVLKKGKIAPTASGLLSNRWKTSLGEFGALIDVTSSQTGTRTDAFQVEPYYPRTDVVNGKTVWIPKGAQWRTLEFERKREGLYGALQWKPSNALIMGLTYFKSRYNMQWDEQAIFAQSSPYNIAVSSDATYDAKGVLRTGTLSDPKDGGINFGDDTRTSKRTSTTTDMSWNAVWRPMSKLTVTADLQKIHATTSSIDSTVATGVQMAKEKLDLTGRIPNLIFDSADKAFLADPKNYYWAFTQEHLDASTANEKAFKTDLKYDFEHPVLRDISFGVRLTDRDSLTENSNPSYNWAAITQTWQVGGDIGKLASLGDARFSGNTSVHTFDNFFNGKVSVPAVVFPNVSLATGYPGTYVALHKYHDILCAENHGGDSSSCGTWKPASFGTDPAGVNGQLEKTKAFYTQARFGFDDLPMPINGNIGVRYVKTNSTAHGYTVFSPTNVQVQPGFQVIGPAIPTIAAFAAKQDYENSYSNVLPSLNLRMKASDKLQFRFGYAGALSRPDFSQLQAYTSLSQSADTTTNTTAKTLTVNRVSHTGEASGNPMLKPTTSKQMDVTAEWYFAPGGSLTMAVFNKQLKDIVINQLYNVALTDVNGKAQNFTTTGPVNGAKGYARGVEIAYQQYFDNLPSWATGFGMQANFTFVDSKRDLYKPVFSQYCSGSSGGAANLNLNLNGCDTDGTTFGNMPLNNLSRQSANLALMYDHGPISSRIAYSWRSRSLQAINVNGTKGGDGYDSNPASATYKGTSVAWGLPTWAAAYGQLDASIFYSVGDNLKFGLEAQNLTDSTFKQEMEQHTGVHGRAWFVSGPRYTATMRYAF